MALSENHGRALLASLFLAHGSLVDLLEWYVSAMGRAHHYQLPAVWTWRFEPTFIDATSPAPSSLTSREIDLADFERLTWENFRLKKFPFNNNLWSDSGFDLLLFFQIWTPMDFSWVSVSTFRNVSSMAAVPSPSPSLIGSDDGQAKEPQRAGRSKHQSWRFFFLLGL